MTLGQQLDAAIDSIDSLSSSQLYVVIVAGTVAVSFLLLNSNGSSTTTTTAVDSALLKSTNKTSRSANPAQSDLPEPRWFILKWVNVAAALAFGGSVVKFSLNASMYLNDSKYLLQFLVVWSMFLFYFFGFFGISFVNADNLAETMEQQQEPQKQRSLNESAATTVSPQKN